MKARELAEVLLTRPNAEVFVRSVTGEDKVEFQPVTDGYESQGFAWFEQADPVIVLATD